MMCKSPTKMKTGYSKALIYWVPVFIYLLMIFAFSQQTGWQSHRVSGAIAGKIVRWLSGMHIMIIRYDAMDLIVRKAAHYLEYSILAILVCRVFLNLKAGTAISIFYTLTLCIIFAGLDELHQLLIIGRTSKLMDVAIDTLGVFSGLFLVLACRRLDLNQKNK